MGFTRALGAEWARHSIQVNAVAPGWFVTDMNAEAFGDQRVSERLLRDVPRAAPDASKRSARWSSTWPPPPPTS